MLMFILMIELQNVKGNRDPAISTPLTSPVCHVESFPVILLMPLDGRVRRALSLSPLPLTYVTVYQGGVKSTPSSP